LGLGRQLEKKKKRKKEKKEGKILREKSNQRNSLESLAFSFSFSINQ